MSITDRMRQRALDRAEDAAAERAVAALRSPLSERMQQTAQQTQTAVCPVCQFRRMPVTFVKCGDCQQQERREAWVAAKQAEELEQWKKDEEIRKKIAEIAGRNIEK